MWLRQGCCALSAPPAYYHGMVSAGDYCNPENANDSWKDRAELVRIAAQKAKKLHPGESAAASKQSHGCCAVLLLRLLTEAQHKGHRCRSWWQLSIRAGSELDVKWHVGDTPMDVQAAHGGGAEALGVLTGVYSQEVLKEANPSECTAPDVQTGPGLHDLHVVLQLMPTPCCLQNPSSSRISKMWPRCFTHLASRDVTALRHSSIPRPQS